MMKRRDDCGGLLILMSLLVIFGEWILVCTGISNKYYMLAIWIVWLIGIIIWVTFGIVRVQDHRNWMV